MTSHLNKQVQLMMNLSLLSSLNQKTIPTIPQYHPLPLPQTQPVYQIIHQPLTQMSYHSMISPKTTLLSYDVNQATTNDCSINNGFVNSLYCSSHPKANTVMSYQLLLINTCNISPGLMSMQFCVAVAYLFSVLYSFLLYEYATIRRFSLL